MEREFPKNVKQIGNVSDNPKVYVEDYVETFLNQLTKRGGEDPAGAFLLGEATQIGEQDCLFVTGAVQMQELVTDGQDFLIGPEHLEMAKAESREAFHSREVVGWFLIAPGQPMALSSSMARVHEKLFPKKNSLFILKGGEEQELYFVYKFRELMEIGGHYIFYERNPDMQSYMIRERRQIGVTPGEVVEDRAAKNFRTVIRGRMEQEERRRESRYVYLTSILLVVVVMAIGISTMNNYDKMNSVQSSIETLASGMQQTSETAGQTAGEALTAEAAGGEEVADGGDSDSGGADSTGNADSGTGGQGDAGDEQTGTRPETSTIQEELSENDYYTVQKGDTLASISKKLYGTTTEADAICRMNGLEDGNLIFIGQKLLLP